VNASDIRQSKINRLHRQIQDLKAENASLRGRRSVDIESLVRSALDARNSTIRRRDVLDLVHYMAYSLDLRGVDVTDNGAPFHAVFLSPQHFRRLAEERGWFADELDPEEGDTDSAARGGKP
jgi:hypothetical protein